VADLDLKSGVVGEVPQLGLPERKRFPLEPPQSAVIVSVVACG